MKMFMFLFEQLMVVQRQTIFKYHIETLKSPDPRDMALSLLPKISFGFLCITYELGLYTLLFKHFFCSLINIFSFLIQDSRIIIN